MRGDDAWRRSTQKTGGDDALRKRVESFVNGARCFLMLFGGKMAASGQCGDGGTGRRVSLRRLWPKGCAGSNPVPRTIFSLRFFLPLLSTRPGFDAATLQRFAVRNRVPGSLAFAFRNDILRLICGGYRAPHRTFPIGSVRVATSAGRKPWAISRLPWVTCYCLGE